MSISDKRFRAGRLSVYIEPRDAWWGLFFGKDALYCCPAFFVVFRWDRRRP